VQEFKENVFSEDGDYLRTKNVARHALITYISEYYCHKRAKCSRFHQNNFLENGGYMRSKHVARHGQMTYISEYYCHKRAKCIRFIKMCCLKMVAI
jgi:hypothetical protein